MTEYNKSYHTPFYKTWSCAPAIDYLLYWFIGFPRVKQGISMWYRREYM